MKNRAVTLVAEFPPPYGGMAVQAQAVKELLTRQGHTVTVVQTNALGLDNPWRRIRLLRGLINECLFLKRLVSGTRNASLIHLFSHSFVSFFAFTVPTLAIAHLRGIPVLVHYHGGAARQFLRSRHSFPSRLLKRFEPIAVPSEFLTTVFADAGINTLEIPNILDLDVIPARPRQEFRPLLLTARNLEPQYNIACAIRALALLSKQHSEARLTIAGDGSERAALEDLCRELGVADRVEFAGNVSNERVRELFARCDVLVNPTRVDNQPVSVLEGFAHGLAVVSTNVGGMRWLITQEANGLLVPDDDAAAMAAAISRVLTEARLGERLSANASAYVQKHRPEQVYRYLEAAYATRLGAPAPVSLSGPA